MSRELEIKVVVNEPNKLSIRIRGEDHTLLNLLTEELNKLENVTFAAYRQEHPLTGEYVLTIVTDGKIEPLDALKEASENLKRLFEGLLKQVRKG